MHRYYMTRETQQAVIAESNRMIALRALNVARRRFETSQGGGPFGSEGPMRDDSVMDSQSTFARLVADLAANPDGPDRG